MASLAVLLLPVAGVGAAEEPAAGGDDSASEAETQADAMPDDSASGVEMVRYAGSDQYELSLAVAQALVDADGGASEWVVLASGESWTEAAAAGPLAASLGGPVVLVPPGGLQTATARPDLVEFLRSSGVRRVVIVGDPDVLPNHEPSVLYGLGMLPRNIERLHGDDPIGNAIVIAERLGAPAEFEELGPTVLIASDQSMADAVAVGPLAAAGPFPLLLTARDVLDPRIAAYLTEHEIAHVVLVGGTAAVTPEVQGAIENAGASVTRLAGRDRSDTARLAAELFEQHTADDPDCDDGSFRIGLVPAPQPEQALTASPLLARQCTPLYYVQSDRLAPALRNTLFLAQHGPPGAHVMAFADDQVLPDGSLKPAVPPVRFAAWHVASEQSSGEREVVLVVIDEDGLQRQFPGTSMNIPPHASFWNKQLSWAPDGRRVAYRHATDHGLRVLDVVTGALTPLRYEDYVPRLDTDLGVEWSPDGSLLLFAAFIDDDSTVSDFFGRRELATELFVFDVTTESVSRLTHNDVTESPEQWTPDGRFFSYYNSFTPFTSGLPSTRKVGLYTYGLDTGQSRKIYGLYFRPVYFEAQWSRDGKRLAFSGTSLDGAAHWWTNELFVADLDGTNLEQLTPSNCPECAGYRNTADGRWGWPWTVAVSWSPNNERIAYHGDTSLQVHDFATGTGHVLIPYGDSGSDFYLHHMGDVLGWSADSRVLYALHAGEECRIAAFEFSDVDRHATDSRGFDTPTRNAGCGYRPAISPDGSHFAVTHPQAGLQLFGTEHRQWQEILSDWSTTDPAVKNQLEGCLVEWTNGGILGRCDHLQPPDKDQ